MEISNMSAQKISYEDNLKRVEKIVDLLEHGELPLEESLKIFTEGVTLTKKLQKDLNTAEKTISKLTLNDDQLVEDKFE